MIRRHEFNSEWWRGEVGIVDLDSFANSSDEVVIEACSEFDWVEARSKDQSTDLSIRLSRLGFRQFDTQIGFRVGLKDNPPTPSLESLEATSALVTPFELRSEEILPFSQDRYSWIPDSDSNRARERYALWGVDLILNQPEHALAISREGEVQGYFLSRNDNGRLDLTLAMLRKGAVITGMHLYQRALSAYAQAGWRVGSASFSARNLAVLNIYSSLGARFTGIETFWYRKSG